MFIVGSDKFGFGSPWKTRIRGIIIENLPYYCISASCYGTHDAYQGWQRTAANNDRPLLPVATATSMPPAENIPPWVRSIRYSLSGEKNQ